MVIDSSALFAILLNEQEGHEFVRMIRSAPLKLMSAATAVEAAVVALTRRGEPGMEQLHELVSNLGIETAAFTATQAKLAIEAARRFGKGRHPAGLNLGDCFSYALAKATGEPLLFKGNDFSRTDITSAA